MTTDAQPTMRYETRDRKAYLTLDRPDRLNAIVINYLLERDRLTQVTPNLTAEDRHHHV